MDREVLVYVDLQRTPRLVGRLWARLRKDRENATFEYDIGKKPVLLLRRFDRQGGARVPFVSAMSILDARDNEARSYLEFVDVLRQHGASPRQDRHALWRRIVFSILISNTDDHLRNHGFLWVGQAGWRLSPAYDLNPSIDRDELTLAINEVETACDVAIALESCREYGLSRPEANEIVERVRKAAGAWRTEAARLRIPRAEQDLMAQAFE